MTGSYQPQSTDYSKADFSEAEKKELQDAGFALGDLQSLQDLGESAPPKNISRRPDSPNLSASSRVAPSARARVEGLARIAAGKE